MTSVLPVLFCEPESKPGVDGVSEENAEGGAGYHEAVDFVARISEDAHKNSGEDHKVRDVVEHESEEGVQIAPLRPAISLFL